MAKIIETSTPSKKQGGRTAATASTKTTPKGRTKKQGTNAGSKKFVASSPDRLQWIAEAAYYRALNRGFEPGNEDLDWLEAEQDYEKRGTLQ